jgi:hypothetical protein
VSTDATGAFEPVGPVAPTLGVGVGVGVGVGPDGGRVVGDGTGPLEPPGVV